MANVCMLKTLAIVMIIIIKKVFQYKNQQKWVRFFHLNFD